MTKEEIYKLVCGWIDSGKLVQKSSCKGTSHYYDIWKGVEKGEIFFTGNDRLVVTDKQVRDEFQGLWCSGRVMNAAGVTIRKSGCVTAHAISKLVERGELLKIDKFKSVTLYVE